MSGFLTSYCRKYALEMNMSPNSPGFFFPSPDGGHYHQFTLQDRCHKLFETAGIPRPSPCPHWAYINKID